MAVIRSTGLISQNEDTAVLVPEIPVAPSTATILTEVTPHRRSALMTQPKRALAGLTLLVVAVAAIVAWVTTEPTRLVPVPSSSASPEQVVRAYLTASTAHDVATMNALSAGDRFERASRFKPTWMVSGVKTYPPRADGGPGTAWTTWHQVVRVDIDMRMLKGHDMNFPDDTDTYWGYILARQTDHDPWRIVDQGVG